MFLLTPPMDVVWGDASAPNELHAALRQMSLGKAAGRIRLPRNFLSLGEMVSGKLLLEFVRSNGYF